MTYVERIVDLRESKNLTQAEVAHYLGVAQNTYSDYERDKVKMPVKALIELAEFYDVDMNYITGVSNEKRSFPKLQNKRVRKTRCQD